MSYIKLKWFQIHQIKTLVFKNIRVVKTRLMLTLNSLNLLSHGVLNDLQQCPIWINRENNHFFHWFQTKNKYSNRTLTKA